ncbi:MAG TPA: hydroxylamine reductase [Anaerolineae bacterium]|nr:hydroxylamine reductase [Anaerolineae bacterium]HQJ51358.1 hydroxylamine reductase [Anaerolineae bacterium]
MEMFCYQCQETAKNTGCTVRGVCGKEPEVAALQDLLIWTLKGLSFYGVAARKKGADTSEADLFVAEGLFTTITNANFDPERFVALVKHAVTLRDQLRAKAGVAGPVPEMATWKPSKWTVEELVAKGATVGVRSDPKLNEDIRSLRELLIYGLKGLAAYTHHAYMLDHRDDSLLHFLQEALLETTNDKATVEEMTALVLKAGQVGVTAMALLDKANTDTYGAPEPTQVNIGVRPGPAILISGHDLHDLKELLEQTKGKGVNVYTHGEMLPANAYPAFKKYAHLVGNYGGSWWHQQDEFEKFGGAILLTTNCLIKPRDSYKGRLFTTGPAGYPGIPHIADRPVGGQKDFGPVIASALASGSPLELEKGTIPIGFAHDTVLSVADKVIAAVKSGALKRFVVMAGCDGRHKERQYFTDVAKALPADTIILTAGCAKYRYNKLNLGDIGGIPRVLDAGQCNDSYSLVVVALKLAEAFGVSHPNELPISYDIGWYEQKAVIVLLALLSLGVKNIRLGPTLPAFVSPNVLQVLIKNFDLKPTTTVEADVAAIAAGK